ncbi:MAG: CbtA family protein [bacterium]
MIKHMLASGLIAGCLVACLVTVLQFAFQEDHVLLAERYESGELVHFQPPAADHDHASTETATQSPDAAAPDDHDHMHGDAEESFALRQSKSVLAALVTYCGYGLVIVSGFAMANQFGIAIPPSHGLLWGLAGFACFQLAPAMGLEPELPGGHAAPLQARQIWWIGTALATAAGLALLAYGNGVLPRLAAIVLLAIPHVIGAPHLDQFTGVVPPELAASFAARSLGVGLVAWLTLGGLACWLWTRPT